jgi:outer membrane protein OmpA-like peptidoglycan-associated protein
VTSAPVSDAPFSVVPPPQPPRRRLPRPGARTVAAAALSVAGLAGLVVAQVVVVGPQVRSDLEQRSREALADAGITTVTVRVDGRDVVLAGTAADRKQAFVAEHVVDTVDGVRSVDTSGLVVGGATPSATPTPTAGPATKPAGGPTASPSRPASGPTTLPGTGPDATGTVVTVVADGGKALVAGAFPSTTDRSTFVRTLEQTYGAGDVTAQAVARATAVTTGTDGVAAVLAALGPDARAVTVSLSGGRITVAARVAGAATKSKALAAAAKAVSGPGAVLDAVVVAPAAGAPPADATDAALEALPALSFGDGQSTPGPIGRTILAAVAFHLAASPDATVTLEGHTDDTGDAAADTATSLDRARACKDYLAALGVLPARVKAVGAGSAPVVPADPAASNRRLVVRAGD